MEQLLVKLFDRILHHSTTDKDTLVTVGRLRTKLNGKLMTDVLDTSTETNGPPRHRPYDAWKQEIADLKQRVVELQNEKSMSDRARARQIKSLNKVIEQLQRRVDQLRPDVQPGECGYYTAVQFNSIVLTKFGKDHGVKKALVEKNQQQRLTNPDLPKITDSLLQKWRREDCYPVWMVEQLHAMAPEDLLQRKPWTAAEKAYLHELYTANPNYSNLELADLCSKKFGRYITDSSIRGALHRARQVNVIAPYRPKS